MKDKTKRILLNIATVATILVMVIIGVLIVGNRKGWFEKKASQNIPQNESGQVQLFEQETGKVLDVSLPELTETTENYEESQYTTTEQEKIEYTEEESGYATEEPESSYTTEEVTTEIEEETTSEDNTTSETVTDTVTKTCSITIQCTSILDNMDNLKEGKEAYVPSSGYILSATMEYTEGETVFDVLNRACSMYGIQIEYAYTPIYGSYYIEGINHLYEFDCGGMSGWKYMVNGSSPNYGCSNYTVNENDSIVWYYTCD